MKAFQAEDGLSMCQQKYCQPLGDTKGPRALYDTAGELPYNKPPYNKVLSLTNDILHPSNRKVYGTGDNETSLNIENILAFCYIEVPL